MFYLSTFQKYNLQFRFVPRIHTAMLSPWNWQKADQWNISSGKPSTIFLSPNSVSAENYYRPEKIEFELTWWTKQFHIDEMIGKVCRAWFWNPAMGWSSSHLGFETLFGLIQNKNQNSIEQATPQQNAIELFQRLKNYFTFPWKQTVCSIRYATCGPVITG